MRRRVPSWIALLPGVLVSAHACGVLAGCGGASVVADAHTVDADDTVDAAPGDAGQLGGVCPVEGYAPCGGTLADTHWSFAGLCPEAPGDVPCERPFDDPACAGTGSSVACTLEASGSVDFTAAQVHIVRELYVNPTYVFTPACLAAVKPDEATPEARCAAIANPPKLACSYAADACTCTAHVGPEPSDDTVTYAAADAHLALGGELSSATYCVDGDRLVLDFDPHPQSWRYWVLDRAP